jgi:hypothetical protein
MLSQQEFVNSGKTMLGRAQNGETLTITKIVIGSGLAAQPSDLWPLTALIAHEMDATISTQRDYGNGTLLVEGSILSVDAPHAFQLREVGVMAHIAAETDQLYSVANVFDDPPDTIDPAATTVEVFKIKLIIDRIPTGNVVIQIGPSENVVGTNIGADTVGPGWYKDAAGNVLSFKRVVQGTGMDIHDAPDDNSVYVGIKTLQNNLDLYVPLTYPGITDPNVLFPTIQAAHDYLLQFVIPPSKFATIHVAAGTFHHNGIVFSHPNAQQINLTGWPRVDIAVGQINYLAPNRKNVSCLLAGLVNGMKVYLANCDAPWAGGADIFAVNSAGGYVTLTVPDRSSSQFYTLADHGIGRRLSYFPTVLINDSGGTQLNFPNGINLVQNICVQGGSGGFIFGATSVMQNCMAFSCTTGILINGPLLTLHGEVVVTDADFGLEGIGTINATEVLFVNGCGAGVASATVLLAAITSGMPNSFAYLNHNGDAIRMFGGSLRGGSIYYDNNDRGMVAQHGAIVWLGPAYGCFPGQNTAANGIDLYAQGMSYIEYTRLGAAVPSCNPTVDLTSNQNALIHVFP